MGLLGSKNAMVFSLEMLSCIFLNASIPVNLSPVPLVNLITPIRYSQGRVAVLLP